MNTVQAFRRNVYGSEIASTDDVLRSLKYRSESYTNMNIDRVSDLNIHWKDNEGDNLSGWYATIGGKDYQLTDQCIRSASRLIGISDIRHWRRYPDRNAFPTALAHILENPATNGSRHNPLALIARHDGFKLRTIQDASYKVMDAYNIMSDFLTMVSNNVGDIHGIAFSDSPDSGDICSYKVVVGTNIMPNLKSEFGQYMMFLMSCSETGYNFYKGKDTLSAVGLMRTICINSAFNTNGVSWDHFDGMDEFYTKSEHLIRHISYYRNQYEPMFEALRNTPLGDLDISATLTYLKDRHKITAGHYAEANVLCSHPTEDGREMSTYYDFFNLLTLSAQALTSPVQRQNAEMVSLELFSKNQLFN